MIRRIRDLVCVSSLILCGWMQPAFGQVTPPTEIKLEGEIRPRAEYRHGYGTLANTHQEGAFYVQQRTRLNAGIKMSDIEVYLSFQDIRVWGSQPQLVDNDGALTAIHQAWGIIKLHQKWDLKFGRQEISYDDERLFGAVNWAQQARSHDALLLRYQDSTFKAHLGLAYNQDGIRSNTTLYTTRNNYKTMQYLWLHKDWKNLNLSLLVLNNGVQVIPVIGNPSVNYAQTYGGRIGWKKGKLAVNGSGYYQGGVNGDTLSSTMNAYQASLDVTYKVTKKLSATGGYEMLSGNSQASANGENNAFNPYFGTNHKFNGYMDYFYVGNHIGSVGLNDGYLTAAWKEKGPKQLKLVLTGHVFYSNADVVDARSQAMDSYLGTELDFSVGLKLTKNSKLNFGYSHLFASDTMERLKGGDRNEVQNWAWAMITLKPSYTFKPKIK
ncbi:alginate export family protein [bacterium SCSIO 12741]|nr:alginate export family protein [bacterium SCSIO 12741]